MKIVDTTYARYINGPEWGKKRRQRLSLDGHKCARCESTERLEVHHLTYDRLGNERIDDLVTLCRICHKKDHGRDPDLPVCLSAADHAYRLQAKWNVEIWHDALAEALAVNKALDDLEDCIGEKERLDQVRALLGEIMRDYAQHVGQEWAA